MLHDRVLILFALLSFLALAALDRAEDAKKEDAAPEDKQVVKSEAVKQEVHWEPVLIRGRSRSLPIARRQIRLFRRTLP